MSIEKTIVIKADTSGAVKDLDNLKGGVESVGDSADNASKGITGINKASKTASVGIKAMGTAFKAIGIGLVVALFAKLAEIVGKNQRAIDFFSNTMVTLEIAFKDLYSFVTSNFMPAFENLKKFFDNLTFDKIKKAIQENITERFNSLLEVLGFVGTALKKLFEGDFKGALDSVKEAGKEMVDVFTGVDDTVGKVGETITKGADAISNYTKKTYEQAKAITELNNQALISQAINQGLIEKYDRQAEKLRQIRDDESAAIEDRIEANKKLGDVLNDQEDAMLKNANLVIQAAENNVALNDSTENQVALIQAQNEKLAIQAQIDGKRSEQLVNINSLLREQKELNKTPEGEEVNQEEINKKLREFRQLSELEKIEDEKAFALAELDRLKASEAEKQLVKDFYNDKRQNQKQKEADEEKKLDENVANAKFNIANNTAGLIGMLAKKGTALAKTAAVAQATISGIKGVQNAYTTAQESPITVAFPAYPLVQAGLAGAFSAVQIKNILSTNEKTGGSSPSIGGGGGSAPSAPSFNLVSGSGSNQIAEGLAGQNQPLKAFVVSSDVSNAQSLDRNIIENSSL
jgi:hypothetical protein